MGNTARLIFALLLAFGAASAQAETYPDRPIRLIVSIAAGSVTDVIMRNAAVELHAAARRPAAGDREPRRRQRHRRGAGLRAGRARRLHALRHLPRDDVVQSAAVRQPALRSRPRPRAGRPAVLSERRPVRLHRARRELRRRAQGAGAGEIRQAQLRHARRRLVPGPVPALDEQSVGHQDRRRALSKAAARRRRRSPATRCR